MASGGCCDTVFLPHVEHTNIFGLSQVRLPHLSGFSPFLLGSRIRLGPRKPALLAAAGMSALRIGSMASR